jgi:hypothetical protein
MGNNYGFVSPGGMSGNAIEDFLMKREEQERRRILDALEQKAQADRVRLSETELAQRGQQIAGANADRDAQRADAEYQRKFNRQATLDQTAMPGDMATPEQYAEAQELGFGGRYRKVPGVVSQGAQIDEQDGIPLYDVTQGPETIQHRGGSQYLSARQAAEERAAQAQQAQAAAAERADADRASRETLAREGNDTRAAIAGMARGNASATADLQREILQQRIDAGAQKATDQQEQKGRARNAAQVRSQQTIDVLKELADFDPVTGKATLKPGAANLFGAQNPLARLVPGSDTNNSAAALRRLTGTAVIDLINEMKNQSATGATGFGSLSGSEGKLLETSASELGSPLISDERAATELERMYRTAQQLYGGTPTTQAAPAQYQPGQTITVDGRPAIVTGVDPATGKPKVRFQ